MLEELYARMWLRGREGDIKKDVDSILLMTVLTDILIDCAMW